MSFLNTHHKKDTPDSINWQYVEPPSTWVGDYIYRMRVYGNPFNDFRTIEIEELPNFRIFDPYLYTYIIYRKYGGL